jgi:hypothetical protein
MLPQWYKRHGEAFLSRIYIGDETWFFHNTPEGKLEFMTSKLPHSPVKKFNTVQSHGKVMSTVFCVVCALLLVDLTPLSSAINAAAYQETLKRLKEAIWQKRPECWPEEFLLCNTVLILTLLLQSWIFWTHEGGRFFHIHQAVLICSVRLPSVPRDEKAPPRSVLPLHWICSKWSQELVICLVHNIVYEELDKLVCHYDMCLNRLCDCVG